MISYGFVYLWFDRHRQRFYIGSHHGREDDGYIGSSLRLCRAYKKRPGDFRRRILQRIYEDDPALTRHAETTWLQLIQPSELGVRYYNLKRVAFGGNVMEGASPERRARASAAMRAAAQRGSNHRAARAVVIEGVRYATCAEARIVLGFNVSKRLLSKSETNRNWYYEDQGPLPLDVCQAYDREQKAAQLAHLARVAEENSRRPADWHAGRIRKGLPKRTNVKRSPFSEITRRRMALAQSGRKHSNESIEKMSAARRAFWARRKLAAEVTI